MPSLNRKGNNDQIEPADNGKARFLAALRIAMIYLIISALWIFFSDTFLSGTSTDQNFIELVSIIKGLAFVVASALLIFLLVRQALKKEAAYSVRLDESLTALRENYALLNESRDRLASSEEQYRQLFTAMVSGYCVHEIVYGIDGEPIGIHTRNTNPAFAAIADYDPARLTAEEAFLRLLPGDRATWLKNLNEAATGGRSMRFQVFLRESDRYLEFMIFQTAPGRFAALITDITVRKQMERDLDAETQQLRVTLNSIGDGVIAVDEDGRVKMLNGVAAKILGVRSGHALGRNIVNVLEQCGCSSSDEFVAHLASALSSGQVFRGRVRLSPNGAPERLIACSASPMTGSDGEPLGYVAVIRDMSDQEKKEAEILFLNYHDLLTGLYNRTFFEEELKRLDTERQLPLSIIMGDANNLKLINDVFGHMEGDEMLKVLAQALKESCRSEDIISRWGGDEFTILLPHTDRAGTAVICRRILDTCRKYTTVDRNLSPSISLGYDTKASMDVDINHVIKAAEEMMYQNKLTDGRNAHSQFLQAMRQRVNLVEIESEAHISRIAELCARTGREMGLQEGELSDLKILSLLHDIGKAAIDSAILNKPGRLTEEEWEEIKRHSGIGYRIVRSAPELVLVADYILGHHERWDGNGYPQGLKGDVIPLPSRILAVVDAFDAMTHCRPYREPLNQETALMELYRNAGTQFDPVVVYAFASVLNQLTDTII